MAGVKAVPGPLPCCPLPFMPAQGLAPELPTPSLFQRRVELGERVGVRQADPAGCLVQDSWPTPPPPTPLPSPTPWGPWVCLYSALGGKREVKETSLWNSFRNTCIHRCLQQEAWPRVPLIQILDLGSRDKGA